MIRGVAARARASGTPLCIVLVSVLGCEAAPAADPEFSDAATYIFSDFDTDHEADLAFAARAIEAQLYTSLDLWAESSRDRALTQGELSASDIAEINNPGRDPALCTPIAVARPSAYDIGAHVLYPVLADQTPVEPSSPDHYVRTFVDAGDQCWPTRDCHFLRTVNDHTKDNLLMTVTFELKKDYRWLDLNLPDPSTVEDGEEPVNDGEERWGIVARSWSEEVAVGDNGNVRIEQSYSVELWLPRGAGQQANPDDGSTTGTLRMMGLWAETTFTNAEFDEELVSNTTRTGIDQIFERQDSWLEDQGQ